jgi:cyclohexa-1,5-dienecarbonyl-CoA hydratase
MAEEAKAEEIIERVAPLEPKDFKFVRYRVEGGVARMTLDRPEHNLLHEQMLKELAAGVEAMRDRDDAKLLVVDAAGSAFSGGIDVGEYTAARVFQMLDAFYQVFSSMLDVGKPVLTVVNGPAIGGGAELAVLGDLVIATPKARFALPEVKIGVFPPLASTIFPHLVGPKVALEMVLTGQPISAERAHQLGLVSRLVAEEHLEKTIQELVAHLAGQSSAVLAMAKKAIVGSLGLSLADGLRNSMNIFLNELYKLEDSQEGLRAMVEKRQPRWKNR